MSKAGSAAEQFLKKNQAAPLVQQGSFKEAFETHSPGKNSHFNGMFGNFKLSEAEQASLHELLNEFQEPDNALPQAEIKKDLKRLLEITANVKGVKAQSLLLQGEQIKEAQLLLRKYRDGAFTKWLIAAYGNRQTPYSILQYYEFHLLLPAAFRHKIEVMPKKAAYTLASREGDMEKKLQILEQYDTERDKPADIILLIQEVLPKKGLDGRRRQNYIEKSLSQLKELTAQLTAKKMLLSPHEKQAVGRVAKALLQLV